MTRAKGDEYDQARLAIAAGARTLVVAGGDGTWGAAAAAIIDSGGECRLALLATGTGNDFAKSLGIPMRDVDATLRLATGASERRVDVGRVDGQIFLNVAGFGFDVAVLENMERPGARVLRGAARYYATALRLMFAYGGFAVGVDESPPAPTLLLAIANGRFFGGTFQIAPGASLTDGALDLVRIGDAKPVMRARLFAAATRGTHVSHREVVVERGAGFTLEFDSPPAYEADGELRRARGATVRVDCLSQALRIAAPDTRD